MRVAAYQSRILESKGFVYHSVFRPCHSSAWISSTQGFVVLRQDQADAIGGRFCMNCARKDRHNR